MHEGACAWQCLAVSSSAQERESLCLCLGAPQTAADGRRACAVALAVDCRACQALQRHRSACALMHPGTRWQKHQTRMLTPDSLAAQNVAGVPCGAPPALRARRERCCCIELLADWPKTTPKLDLFWDTPNRRAASKLHLSFHARLPSARCPRMLPLESARCLSPAPAEWC